MRWFREPLCQRASQSGESTWGNQRCIKRSFWLVFMVRTGTGRYRPPVFLSQVVLRTIPRFYANFQERRKTLEGSYPYPHIHSQENKKSPEFFLIINVNRTGIPLHNKWLSLTNTSYSERSNRTSLSQQAVIPFCCMALQENMHSIISQKIINTGVLT